MVYLHCVIIIPILTPIKQQILFTFRISAVYKFVLIITNNIRCTVGFFIMACAYILVNIDYIIVSGTYY